MKDGAGFDGSIPDASWDQALSEDLESSRRPVPGPTPLRGSHRRHASPDVDSDVAAARQIKILFLGANPSDTTRLALGREVRDIDQRLRSSEHRDAFRIEQVWAVRPSDLQQCLLRYRPTIVHFSGHGSAAGQILLEDESGKAVPIYPEALAGLFQVVGRRVQCVVLNACYTEAQARALVAHVGCVIGMTAAVSDAAAGAFAGAFYQALGFGEDVQSAFELGCNQMHLMVSGAAGSSNLQVGHPGQAAAAHLVVPRLLTADGLRARDLRLFQPVPRVAVRLAPDGHSTAGTLAAPGESEAVRELRERLEQAHARRSALQAASASTTEVDREILELRRRLRDSGQLRAGDSLGDCRYLLIERIGRGGFAVVWRALDRELEKEVAIKVLHTNLAGDPIRLERFIRGARCMADLGHEAVVRVLEPHGEDGGFHYFVMEYVRGGDLRHAVLEQRLQAEQVIPVILRVAEALGTAHARGMVHRDVKPANILLDEDGSPKLTDFDLVAAAETTGGTRTGAMGTFVYAAPELMDQPQDADARADVYALGMTAAFCLGGAELPPIILRQPEKVLAALPCSEAVRDVLRAAIEWEPEGRFADARAFGEALSRAAQGLVRGERPSRGTPPAPQPGGLDLPRPLNQAQDPAGRGRTRWVLMAAAALVGAGVLLWSETSKEPVMHLLDGGESVRVATVMVPRAASAALSTSASAVAMSEGSCPMGMALIPGGSFRMGEEKGLSEARWDEVKVDRFCLDETEVTIEAYTACVRAERCTAAWTAVDWSEISAHNRNIWSQFCAGQRTERGKHPINCVDWYQAGAYCEAQAKRLPTEVEWEYAARGGSEQRTYPWGNALPAPDMLNACGAECIARFKQLGLMEKMYPGDDGFAATAPVKSFARGKSRWAVHDMAGNVWEWTSSNYCDDEAGRAGKCMSSTRVLRGGSWISFDPMWVRAAARLDAVPWWRNGNVGFRCASDSLPGNHGERRAHPEAAGSSRR